MHCRCICNLFFVFAYLFQHLLVFLTLILFAVLWTVCPCLEFFLLLLYTTILIIDEIHLLCLMYLGPIVGGHERGHRVDHPPAPP